ncbi:MAG: hypothetical protein CMD38_07410 [Flavobacteriales bacterium]|nr:hypothetical protein [Flavobacteriales bacterium]|tara:strand:- start:451 stop:1410 length:960 start_codon:yes stop_codon:yes gene_type:complete
MASTFTTNLTLEKPAAGDQANAWGNTLNTNFDAIDTAISLKHAGTPQGNLAASFVGQVAIDTSNKVVYIATTAGNAGTAVWTQANAGTITVSGVVSGSGSFSGGAASITTSYAVNPVPSGVISQFGGNAAPTGYLLCDGSAVSRTTYADLYTAISTNYGSGDGSTTFNLPDLQDRFPVGKGSTYSLNNQGGVSSITPSGSVSSFTPSGSVSVTVNNHTLTTNQIPAHNHLITHAGGGISANYFHPTYGASIPFGDNNTSIATNPFYQYPSACMTNTGGGQAHNHGASGSFSGSSVTPTFSGNSASTLPPYICVNYIIKT